VAPRLAGEIREAAPNDETPCLVARGIWFDRELPRPRSAGRTMKFHASASYHLHRRSASALPSCRLSVVPGGGDEASDATVVTDLVSGASKSSTAQSCDRAPVESRLSCLGRELGPDW